MAECLTALVTGGSRGIGRAISQELARLGYGVVVNYASRREPAEETVAAIESAGGRAWAVPGDVARPEDRARLLAATQVDNACLSVLVNNAGITSPGRPDLLDVSEAGWDQVFDTNLKGPFFLAQAAARQMLAQHARGRSQGGKIINVSSISAYAVSTNRADYCLTKAAQGMLTELFAVRLADHGISVYEICPGVIESDMTAPVKEKYDRLIAEGMTPIRRWGRPEDIARAVSALVQDFFPFSTGDRFHIDGGFHIRRL